MDARNLLDKIQEDAKTDAQKTVADAKERALNLQKASDKRMDDLEASYKRRFQTESVALEERLKRMGDLEAKKNRLQKQRELIDLAFENAKEGVRSLPQDSLLAFFVSQAVKTATGDETVLLGRSSDFLGDNFIDTLNQELVKAGKKGQLKKGQATVEGTGFVLESGGVLYDCTLEKLIDAERLTCEKQVADILFS
ncbi:MAG: V-type ATP synthase subunit E [Christensenellales bacterium]|jgi:vacuolar-type H+-ATPase subunit E/Vma4